MLSPGRAPPCAVGAFGPRAVDILAQLESDDGVAPQMKSLPDQLTALAPLLEDHRVHLPVWSVAATRLD